MSTKTLLLLLLLTLPLPAAAWFDCYWPYRTEIYVEEAAGVTVSDYQAKLKLDSSTFHTSYSWSVSADDIRLIDSDDLTPLDFFIESWDQVNKQAVISVKMDMVAGSSNTIYLYYGNPDSVSDSDAVATFTESGTRFHTRYSTVNPDNKSTALSTFEGALDTIAGYGCSVVNSFTGIRNRSQNAPPSISSNVGVYSEAFFEVTSAEAGSWSFRYGGDFGFGGGLYVDDVALEEAWNSNLWWASSWNNPDRILEGSIYLTEGYHKIEVIGFENCCDGPSTLQFKKPGGNYEAFSTSNLDIRSRNCPTIPPNVSWDQQLFEPPLITMGKSSSVLSDPVSGTNSPKRIPGAVIRYALEINNAGTAVGRDSISIDDPLPTSVKALVGSGNIGFNDGLPSSQLSFSYDPSDLNNDDVNFSSDSGASYAYTATADDDGADELITHINFKPKGRFGCSNDSTSASFNIFYDVIIK